MPKLFCIPSGYNNMFDKLIKNIELIKRKVVKLYKYGTDGVWSDVRPLFWVKMMKTVNLSLRAFFDGDIQSKACAMTYRSVLAIVPALALVFAIGKGFGLQGVIEDELIKSIPSQKQLLENAFVFVDSYLNQSSEGLFVGIGIALLLWTLISLLGSVEDAFNGIWGIKEGRSLWRKSTDYLAMFLVLPVLMICAGGLSALFTTSMVTLLPASFSTPVVNVMMDVASFVAIWLFFTAVYIMVPNTKVKFQNAFVAGVFAGTAFILLQWLFVTGQVYVSKYNAIYGSFSFLPLFLIWLQLVWVVTLAGAVVCYASQNIIRYNFNEEITCISTDYDLKFNLALLSVSVIEYVENSRVPDEEELADKYELPSRLVSIGINKLLEVGLLMKVVKDQQKEIFGFAPGVDPSTLTVGQAVRRIRKYGAEGFIPDFDLRFKSLIGVVDAAQAKMLEDEDKTLIKDLTISEVKETLAERIMRMQAEKKAKSKLASKTKSNNK